MQSPGPLPFVALAAVAAAGAYYVLAEPAKPHLSPIDQEKLEEHQVRHYLLRKKKRASRVSSPLRPQPTCTLLQCGAGFARTNGRSHADTSSTDDG